MKKSQKIIISSAIIFASIITIYAPWQYTFQDQGISQVVKPAGYHLIFTPPVPERDAVLFGVKLDIQRYLFQLFGIVILFSGSYFLLNNKYENNI